MSDTFGPCASPGYCDDGCVGTCRIRPLGCTCEPGKCVGTACEDDPYGVPPGAVKSCATVAAQNVFSDA
jgi:hypothetical protein